ncbi:MAG: AMP-binding protein [Oscillospiraceae bacterium]|nr:AMP-binding protein [Oscillospiraceae bacterium]
MNIEAPWLSAYGNVPHTLDYPTHSMVGQVFECAEKYPDNIAYDFFGCTQTYRGLAREIRACAKGLLASGIAKGERVTISMPNAPQSVIMFYALNLIGAVASLIHPLSSEEEQVRYINASRSVAVFTLDQFAQQLKTLLPRTTAKLLILTGVEDGLKGIKKPLYKLTKGRKIKRCPTNANLLRFTDLIVSGRDFSGAIDASMKDHDVAAILYSGGTTGTSKGVMLTNLNINALAMQTEAAGDCVMPGYKMLAILPIFHGFGLGVCIHTALITGSTTILVPQFSLKEYAKLLKKYKPHYIAGVPTLYEALLRMSNIENLDMSQMVGIFCGGDTLSIELKKKVDAFLKKHGSKEQIREGYGMTESVSANCLTPRTFHKEGSIGIPYPDMHIKIIKPGTQDRLPYGEEGEIVISGPTVMKGYDNNEEETNQTLQKHADGRIWLHTGDLGMMDDEGFLFFRQRIKRMIISSGFNVYPSQVENVIEAHESIQISCVIAVPDDFHMQRIKAFIVLKDGQVPTEEIKKSIIDHVRKNVTKYAMPREFEYRKELPKTLIGKVAYLALEKEEQEKRENAKLV